MTILAIDPGPEQSGFVIYDKLRGLGEHGLFPNRELKKLFGLEFLEVNDLAIEMIASYGMPVGKEIFETCVWIGRFLEYWVGFHREETAILIYRRTVKLYLCNNARAKDSNIRQALLDKLGPVGTKKAPGPLYGVKSHAWPALAVAVTALRI